MQADAGRHHLVVPRLGRPGDVGVRAPARDHVASVGRADRPGQPQAVDEQRLADLGRPGGPGVIGDLGQHHLADPPAALPARTQRSGFTGLHAERR